LKLNLCVFASGKGSNLNSIIKSGIKNVIQSKVELIISNNLTSGALELAKKNNIPNYHLSLKQFISESEYSNKLISVLQDYNINLIILAGYMKLIPSEVCRLYKNKILNIHPSLIPSFCGQGLYGLKVHQAVLDYGAKVSGATVHLVDEIYDHGAIVIQKSVKVNDDDTAESLQKRILKIEHKLLPEAIRLFETKKFNFEERKVFFT
jgi:phosphoribosylglycinamide formyltransferase 1